MSQLLWLPLRNSDGSKGPYCVKHHRKKIFIGKRRHCIDCWRKTNERRHQRPDKTWDEQRG